MARISFDSYAQRLDRFASHTASFSRGGRVAKIAFPEISTYFGYLPLDSNQTTNRRKHVSLYLSLETDIKEIGIRVIQAEFFLRFNRPSFPFRVCTDLEDAADWVVRWAPVHEPRT